MQAGDSIWLLCRGGETLMPCVYQGEAAGEEGYCEVASPTGQVYTARVENVVTDTEGRAMLLHRRAESLREQGYVLRLCSNGTYRMACPHKHGRGVEAGYVLRPLSSGVLLCSCPAFAQSGEQQACKHKEGLPGLLLALASRAAQQGQAVHAQTYVDLAADPGRIRELRHKRESFAQRLLARGLQVDRDFA